MPDLTLKFRIDAENAPALAALKQVEQGYAKTRAELTEKGAQIGALQALEGQSANAQRTLTEARRQVEFFKRSAQIGGVSGAQQFAADIRQAQAAVDRASAALRTQGAEASRMRAALSAAGVDTRNLAGEQSRLAAELARVSAAQAAVQARAGVLVARRNPVANAAETLNLRSEAATRTEIQRTLAAYQTLRASGTLTHTELAQAAGNARARVAQLTAELRGQQTATQGLAGGWGQLRNVLLVAQGVLASGLVIGAVDGQVLLEARVKLTTASLSQQRAAMAGILAIANEAKAPIDQVGSSYVRFATAIRAMGAEQQQALDVTRAVALGLRVSGASAQEAGAAMYQLGQAFQKGKLNGDEFVSLAENGGKLLEYMAQAMGVTRGELIQLASDGKLTAEAMATAFQKALSAIERDAAAMPDTVGGALTELANTFKTVAGNSDALRVLVQALAVAVKFLAENLDALVLGGLAAGVVVLGTQFRILAASIATTRLALLLLNANPLILGLTALAAVGGFIFSKLREESKKTADAQAAEAQKLADQRKNLEDRYANLLNRRNQLEKQVAESAKAAQKETLDSQKKSVNEQISDAKRLKDALVDAYQKARDQAASYRQQAQDIRQRARSRSYDDTDYGQARVAVDLIDAKRRLDELSTTGAPIEQIQRQAELVRTIAGSLSDQEASKRALVDADTKEAAALDKAAAAQEEQARGLDDQAKQASASLDDLNTKLKDIEAQLARLTETPKAVQLQADQAALRKTLDDIARVKAALDALPANVAVAIPSGAANTNGATGSFASGGAVLGPGQKGRDSLLAMMAPGEHVLTAGEVDMLGGQDAVYQLRAAIRSGKLPAFSAGGAVGASLRQAVSSMPQVSRAAAPKFPDLGRVEFALGGKTVPAYVEPDMAGELRRLIAEEARKFGGRR